MTREEIESVSKTLTKIKGVEAYLSSIDGMLIVDAIVKFIELTKDYESIKNIIKEKCITQIEQLKSEINLDD